MSTLLIIPKFPLRWQAVSRVVARRGLLVFADGREDDARDGAPGDGLRERVELAPIPASFKGLPIAFIIAGQFALAFLCFSGLQIR